MRLMHDLSRALCLVVIAKPDRPIGKTDGARRGG